MCWIRLFCCVEQTTSEQSRFFSIFSVFYILWEFSFLMTVCNTLLIITLQTKNHLNILGTKSCLVMCLVLLNSFFFVNKGSCVKLTKDLPGWMSPFVIKLPVLILRRASAFFWSALSSGMAKTAIYWVV